MEAIQIITEIEKEERNRVLVRRNNTSPVIANSEIVHEWTIQITNEPERFFAEMDRKYKRNATRTKKVEVFSVEEGIRICRDIYRLCDCNPEEVEFPEINSSRTPLFICLHIRYSFAQSQGRCYS